MADLDALTRDYRAAFLRSLPRGDEAALASGYEIGREALEGGVSLLQIAQLHHDVLLEALDQTRPEGRLEVAAAASTFLLEVLASYDMTQRAVHEDHGP